MSEPPDRFLVEIGCGTVAQIIGLDSNASENDRRFSL